MFDRHISPAGLPPPPLLSYLVSAEYIHTVAMATATRRTATDGLAATPTHKLRLLDIQDSVAYACRKTPPANATPFVMWITQRTGSTWALSLLNSHPEISMAGEVLNNCDSEACFEGMCDLLAGETGAYVPYLRTHGGFQVARTRGFKQKFLYCNHKWHECEDYRGSGLNALELCTKPNLMPNSRNGRTINRFSQHEAATSAAMVDSVGARVICSLRRSAMDLALSVLSHAILVRSCGGISNIQTDEDAACWDRIKREGRVQINAEDFAREVRAQESVIRWMREVCEARARKGPTFFLWYEDLESDFEKTVHDLQVFLQVTPRSLTTTTRKVNHAAKEWIQNYAQLERAALEARITREGRVAQICTQPLGQFDALNSSELAAMARFRVYDACPPPTPSAPPWAPPSLTLWPPQPSPTPTAPSPVPSPTPTAPSPVQAVPPLPVAAAFMGGIFIGVLGALLCGVCARCRRGVGSCCGLTRDDHDAKAQTAQLQRVSQTPDDKVDEELAAELGLDLKATESKKPESKKKTKKARRRPGEEEVRLYEIDRL